MNAPAHLTKLKEDLDAIQKERTSLRSTTKLVPRSVSELAASQNIQNFWQHLIKSVEEQDIYAYHGHKAAAAISPTPAPVGLAGAQTAEEIAQSIIDTEAGGQSAMPAPAAPAAPPPPVFQPAMRAPMPLSQYTTQMGVKIQPAFEPPAATSAEGKVGGTTAAQKTFYAKMTYQAEYMHKHLAMYGPSGVGTLQKIRQAEGYAADGNITAVYRMLKSAKGSDPHNNTLCYLMSQAGYFLVQEGNADLLPEARAEAAKSAAGSDYIPQETLIHYRYEAAAMEMGLQEKKATEWLKEFYLLDAEPISGPEGLGRDGGVFLKPWLLLAKSSSKSWGDYYFESIANMVRGSIGGASLYLTLLRNKTLEEVSNRTVPPKIIEELEKDISLAYAAYKHIERAFGSWPKATENNAWTVRNRFLSDFYNVSKFPTFDEVLMNIALNGRSYEAIAVPVVNFQSLGYRTENYWRLWAIVLAPEQAKKINNMLPVVETQLEKGIYSDLDKALALLIEAETAELDLTALPETQPHMTTFTMDHLVTVYTKKQNARNDFMPSISPFNGLYRQWNEGAPPQTRPSSIIQFAAQQGGFGSAQEVLAAISGAFTLIRDPNYGLKPQQDAAKKVLERIKKGGKSWLKPNVNVNLNAPQVDMTIGQMMMYVFIPISVVSFIGILVYRLF